MRARVRILPPSAELRSAGQVRAAAPTQALSLRKSESIQTLTDECVRRYVKLLLEQRYLSGIGLAAFAAAVGRSYYGQHGY